MRRHLLGIFVTVLLFGGDQIFSQEDSTSNSFTITSLSQIDFMLGTWEGNGWIIIGNEKKNFKQTEIIESRVNNTVYTIDGLGKSADGGISEDKIVHDAVGYIMFDPTTRKIMMTSFATTGGKNENEITLIGNKRLQWQLKIENRGFVKFREDFSKENIYSEVGEFSADSLKWYKFFEMTLYRKK